MDYGTEIKNLLKGILDTNPNLPITATVVSVQGQTCTIKLLGELQISDVRLKATISESTDGFLITPKVGSEVIVMSQTGKLSSLMVIKIDEIEKIEYIAADFEFTVDAATKKVKIKNSQASVGTLIDNLITTIDGLQTTNTDGSTGVLQPAVKTQLNQIKTAFNSILEP